MTNVVSIISTVTAMFLQTHCFPMSESNRIERANVTEEILSERELKIQKKEEVQKGLMKEERKRDIKYR